MAKSSSPNILAQVASKAKVSAGTVSRAFNNSAQIPPETRVRVLDAARELGFRPRVGIRNKQIALVTEPPEKTVMGGYVNTLTQYICFALSQANAGISMITEDRISNLYDIWFDGIIAIAWEEKTIQILKSLRNVPIVWLSDNFADFFHVVYFDSRETGRIAGRYLLEKGHRKVAVIHDGSYTDAGRLAGVEEAMRNIGVDAAEGLVAISSEVPLSLAAKQLVDAGATAVWVTGEDMKVLEMAWILQELMGKSIPGDISLMGFENAGVSEFLRPSLTTIACPLAEMGKRAAGLLLDEFLTGRQKIELPVKLIERASVAALPT